MVLLVITDYDMCPGYLVFFHCVKLAVTKIVIQLWKHNNQVLLAAFLNEIEIGYGE